MTSLTQQDLAYPQPYIIKVLVKLIKSHCALLGMLKTLTAHGSINLRDADEAIDGAARLLNDLRLGEIKVERWVQPTLLWCGECGNNWEGDTTGYSNEECPECGGQCTDA